jgi:hypothetical protein
VRAHALAEQSLLALVRALDGVDDIEGNIERLRGVA